MKNIIHKIIKPSIFIFALILLASCSRIEEKDNSGNHANTPKEEPGDQYKMPNDSAGNRVDTTKKYQH